MCHRHIYVMFWLLLFFLYILQLQLYSLIIMKTSKKHDGKIIFHAQIIGFTIFEGQ